MSQLTKIQKSQLTIILGEEGSVDDLLGKFSELEHQNIHYIKTPDEALEFIEATPPSLIYVSGKIKSMSWLTFMQALRTDPKIPFCPLIFVRADTQVFAPNELNQLQNYLFTTIRNAGIGTEDIAAEFQQLSINEGDPSSVLYILNQAKKYYRDGLIQKAAAIYHDLENEFAGDISIQIGATECSKLDLEEYNRKLHELLEKDPENYNLKFKMLSQMIADDNIIDFRALFNIIIKEMDNSRDLYWLKQLGDLCLKVQIPIFSETIAALLEKKSTREDMWETYIYKARQYLASGDLKNAKVFADKAKKSTNEEKSEIFNVIGVIEKRNGRLKQALDAFKSAKEISSWDYRITFNMALCYKALDQIESTKKHLQEILEHNPGYEKAVQMLETLNKNK